LGLYLNRTDGVTGPEVGTTPEHEAQQAILLSSQSKLAVKDYEMLKAHTFTILSSEKVHVDGKEDNTFDSALHGLDTRKLERLCVQWPLENEYDSTLSGSHLSSPVRPPSTSSNLHQVSCTTPPSNPQTQSSEVRHRYHYRMVMEEVGVPVWWINNLEHAFIACRDALKPLIGAKLYTDFTFTC
jgi:hypothetical protein